NALLNLTSATSFAEFAAEVRDGISHVVVMPEYRQPLALRIVASAADVLSSHRLHCSGRQPWTDRVSVEWRGEVRPLATHCYRGGPWWLRSSVALFQLAASRPLRPILHSVVARRDGPRAVSPIPIPGGIDLKEGPA